MNGTYKVSQPLIYKIEKKFGVCRHLVIPQPIDALVLQVLVENIADQILEKQPSENAFYSRDKHSVSKPHNVEEYGFTWRQQWKQLQEKIYSFNKEKELIIVTDLLNYYDSIDTKELRKVIAGYVKTNEVLIDLLFGILEEISWRPDYLPYSGRGLPTTNIEGIRLLAHSFLFELDEVIKQKTNNSFARWMDDIVIGIDSRKEAIETISAVSDMLKSRGLAINLAKTDIYDYDKGYYHFQIEANRWIDSVETTKKNDPNYKNVSLELHKRFQDHFKNQGAKYWDKIAKRYITTYTKLGLTKLLTDLPKIYVEYPGLRRNLLIYLSKIGYKKQTVEKIIEISKCIAVFDDISFYQLCDLVTQWEIPVTKQTEKFLDEFESIITAFSFNRTLPSDFYCVLWFKAKYNHTDKLLAFILKYQNIWQTNSFLRRQVTAILSRLLIVKNDKVKVLLFNQISSGILNTVTLANQISQLSSIDKLDNKLNLYLFPKNTQRPYPIGKFLVLCSVLNSKKIRTDEQIKRKIKHQIKDPYYLKWLAEQYKI